MTAKTLIVRFSAVVCILLILFVSAFREMKPGETITFQGNRIIQR